MSRKETRGVAAGVRGAEEREVRGAGRLGGGDGRVVAVVEGASVC